MIIINYAEMKQYDVANAPNVCATLFVSGCTHKCKGCFNSIAQDFNYGKPFDKEAEDLFISYCKDPVVKNVCILGGEIFQQDYLEVLSLLVRIKKEVKKPIWVWTGYTLYEILQMKNKYILLEFIDVLIDGKFEKDKKDLSLKHRGSSNQNIWNLDSSIGGIPKIPSLWAISRKLEDWGFEQYNRDLLLNNSIG